ncbi:Piwi domain-containing protein [Apiosordaria backusii]|uniref:Piwi domain-containing protein n=1 Tax=Apiosordaria backusii TaxID=314023 RepID=A0AA40AT09_9PEZI|nr:Piwi domain-containing protein [Apiosordaria backusii]
MEDSQEWSLSALPAYPQDTKYQDLTTNDKVNKRIDLTPEAYYVDGKNFHPFARRPGWNDDPKAKKINVGINQYRIKTANLPIIFQYDISVSPSVDANIVYRKCWENKTLEQHMARFANKEGKKGPWLHDGGKILWSTNDIGNQAVKKQIDLRENEGSSRGKPQLFLVTITKTRVLNLEALDAYLKGKMGWDNMVLESINFLDHVFRSGPTKHFGFEANKRVLVHPKASEVMALNACTEAIKGIYSAIRLNSSVLSGGLGLGVNVDVANNSYWTGQNLAQLARHLVINMCPKVGPHKPEDFWTYVRPEKDHNGKWGPSAGFKVLRRLANIRFKVTHRGKREDNHIYKVKRIMWDADKYGQQGANAKTVTFERKTVDDNTGKETVKTWSVYDFYNEHYKRRINYWQLPLIETTKAGSFPMEVCEVQRFCPYPFKLDGDQTSKMLKFAVQPPRERKVQIERMVAQLKWGEDRFLRHFGITMDTNMPKVEARVISNPGISFGNKITNPGVSGRWDLRGCKFIEPNPTPLQSWAFCITQGCCDEATVSSFYREWKKIYQGHGGRIKNDPIIFKAKGDVYTEVVENAWKTVGHQFKMNPQIIFFILKDKTAWYYERLKRSSDCRYAMPTQMLNAANVRKAQGQYCSNVCLKVNAKLGGCTAIATKAPSGQPLKPFSVSPHFDNQPTMIIGADVSHGPAGQLSPSVAAMTVSMDKAATKYSAAAQTNGWRVEILQPYNMIQMLQPMITRWKQANTVFPKRVFYIRDGVSEGQYAHVMDHEFTAMKKAFAEVYGEANPLPKFTVIIATKRHHIRFFPDGNAADKNGNALPGTIVEREVTHPFQYDFYLCSHVAIKGTARPVHYTVLHDEIKMPPAKLQEMIYHQCYQYVRSTTPVSLHPAVYYAHLVSNRARPHEMALFTDRVPEDVKHGILRAALGNYAKRLMQKEGKSQPGTNDERNKVCPKLVTLGSHAKGNARETFEAGMWFV